MAKILADLALHISADVAELRRGIDQTNTKLNSLGDTTGDLLNTINSFTKGAGLGFDGLISKIGSVATPIGAISAGIGLLSAPFVEFFTNSQEGINMMAVAISELSADVDVFKGGMMAMVKELLKHNDVSEKSAEVQKTLGEASGKFFNFILLGLPHLLLHNKAMDSLIGRMNEATDAAKEYTLATQAEQLAEIGLIVPRAEANRLLVEARANYIEQKGTIQERLNLLTAAQTKEESVANSEIVLARKELINLQNYNQARLDTNQILELSNEDKKKEAELEARISELLKESEQRQIRNKKEILKLTEQQIALDKMIYDKANPIQEADLTSAKKTAGKVTFAAEVGAYTNKNNKLDPRSKTFNKDEEEGIAKATERANKALEEQGKILTDTLQNAFDTLFSSVGAGFKGMAAAFKQMIIQMVEQLLAKAAVFAILSVISGGMFGISDFAVGAAGMKNNFKWFAEGTSFAPGGLSLVGERGPELVNLPRGSQVFSNSQSSNMMGGTLTTKVSGSDLIFILNNTNRKINSFA